MYLYIHSLLSLPPMPHPTPLGIRQHYAGLPVLYSSFQLIVLHMVVYTCQCYSLDSSHPLFPHYVHKTMLYVSISIPVNRFISTIFLESIYMHQHMIFVFLFLTYFILYNWLWFIHLISTDSNSFLFTVVRYLFPGLL